MTMKKGVNSTDQKKIKNYFAQGYKSKEISEILLVDLEVINAFKPKKAKKAKVESNEVG